MHAAGGLATALLALVAQSAALKLPFTRVRRSLGTPFKILYAHPTSETTAVKNFAEPVGDVFDNLYIAVVTIGDRQFNVQLDTGSSDLWVKPNVPAASFGATDLALNKVNITYGSGFVSGTPATAKFALGSYTVNEQAFLDVTVADMGNLFSQGAEGVLGLGFNKASVVQKFISANGTYPASKGQTVLASVFAQHPDERDYITFLLGRTDDIDTTAQGTFTISEVDPKYDGVKAAPALPVFVNGNQGSLQRWTVPVDAVEIAGTTYNVTTSVSNASGKQLALLDTGSSFVLLPEHTVTAIYSSIDGAKFDDEAGVWFVPCLNQTNVSFVFGGQNVYVHPLDLTKPTQAVLKNGTVVTYCVNTFQTNKNTKEFDVVLGDAFLRNVYAMFDWGDSTGPDGEKSGPFVKLLGITDNTTASQDFVQSRKQTLQTLPPLAPIHDPATFAEVKNYVLQSFAKSTTSSVVPPAKSTHKTTHKIGFSGKKGQTTIVSTKKPGNKPVIALASGAKNDGSDPTSGDISSQVQKLLDFSPILLGLLGANVVLGIGLCLLGGYILRSNRAKKLRREPVRRTGTDASASKAYQPVTTAADDGAPLSPLPYRDSVADGEEAAKNKSSGSYRDSGVAFGDVEAARRLSRVPPAPVDTGDLGVRDNSPFLDPNAASPSRSSFAPGRDSIALSDNGPVPRPGVAFPSGGNDRLSIISASRDSLSAPDAPHGRRQSRAQSNASVSRDSVYSQGQGSPFRSPSHDSLAVPGDMNDLAPPQPAFAGGRVAQPPQPSPDSPNARMPLPGPGVGLRPPVNRQPSMSLYEVPQTTEHQLASQQRRYSHVPPAAMEGVAPRPAQFAPVPPFNPQLPARSPARPIPGPPPGAAAPQRPPSV